MSGAFHIRMVAGILLASAGLTIVLDLTTFLLVGELKHPANLLGSVVDIALVIWFCRGSKAAALILSGLLILAIAMFVLLVVAVGNDGGATVIGVSVFGIVAAAYCWWAVTFSRSVRTELAQRREANALRQREERRQFYQQMGETAPD
jgi:hypothetical protein